MDNEDSDQTADALADLNLLSVHMCTCQDVLFLTLGVI